jgi:uncharacterized membrane protein
VVRQAYLDRVRGFAVAIMVEAHVVDAWTREADRHDMAYFWAVFVAGLAAPMFLFLAGVTLALSASGREDREGRAAAAAHVRRRGWHIFVLALLFRLQAQLLGWGALVNLLKVDILNVMGLAMVAAGWLWGVASSRPARTGVFAVATLAMTMLTPLVREAAWLAPLPDPIEWYLRPAPGRTTFTLFPWAGFLLAGAIAGDFIAAARTEREAVRLQAGLLVAGLAGVVLGYGASFQPSIYPSANFWTSSPTFFFIRLGIATAFVPAFWALSTCPPSLGRSRAPSSGSALGTPGTPGTLGTLGTPGTPGTPGTLGTPGTPGTLGTLGRSSLFVYWIHVEMVYGVIGIPLRRALPLAGSLAATVALCGLLYAVVIWKNRMMQGVVLKGPVRILAPVLG